MDQNRVKGALHQAKGAVKEAAGKVSGNVKLQTEGRIEKQAGKAQSTLGKVTDKVKETARR
jgi:uncharacterized protein YjbJ (UPF0337 family)